MVQGPGFATATIRPRPANTLRTPPTAFAPAKSSLTGFSHAGIAIQSDLCQQVSNMPDLPEAGAYQPRSGVARRTLLAAALSLPAWPTWGLPAAQGRVLLSLVGKVSHTNAEQRADFDLAMLDALPQHSFSTETPWFPAPRQFSGPLLRDVLATAGARGSALRAVALNNYKVDIPFDDAMRFDMLLATRLDGQLMPVRDKGPLFIVYPFHTSGELRSERYYSRSAWQLRTIEVK